MDDTYKMNIRCFNCGHSWEEEIPKGCTAGGYFTCPYCGCYEGRSRGKPTKNWSKDGVSAYGLLASETEQALEPNVPIKKNQEI